MRSRKFDQRDYSLSFQCCFLIVLIASTAYAAANDTTPCTEATSQKGFFTGRVTDGTGKPIADATIYWGQNHVYIQYHENAATDINGFYRLEATKQRPSTSHMTVVAEGYAPIWQEDLAPGTCEHPNEVNFTLAASHELTLTVVDEKPISGVRVEPAFKTDNGQGRLPGYETIRSDSSGVVSLTDLPEPKAKIYLTRDRFKGEYFVTGIDSDVIITMAPACVIRGLVIDEQNGLPVRNFRITTIPGASQTISFSDPNGYFEIDNIPWPGSFELIISADNHPTLYAQEVIPRHPDKAETEVYFLPKPHLVKAVLIDGLTHKPISNATITSGLIRYPEFSPGPESMMDVKQLRTDEHGRFTLCEEEGSLSKDYRHWDNPHHRMRTVFINIDGYESIMIFPTNRKKYTGSSGILNIALARGASISGIYAINGQPQKDVELLLVGANRRSFGRIKIDQSGSFMWKNLPEGYYHIRGPFFKYQLKLEKAEQKIVDFTEEMGNCTFSGYAARDNKPLPNATIHIYPNSESPLREFWSLTDDHGFFYFENLKAGTYHTYPGPAHAGGGNDCGPQLVTVTKETEQDLSFFKRY